MLHGIFFFQITISTVIYSKFFGGYNLNGFSSAISVCMSLEADAEKVNETLRCCSSVQLVDAFVLCILSFFKWKDWKEQLNIDKGSKPRPYGENLRNQVTKNATVIVYKNKKRQEELSREIWTTKICVME